MAAERVPSSPTPKKPDILPKLAKKLHIAVVELPNDPQKITTGQIKIFLQRLDNAWRKKHQEKPPSIQLPESLKINPKSRQGRRNLFKLFRAKEEKVLVDIGYDTSAKKRPKDNVAAVWLRSLREATLKIFNRKKRKITPAKNNLL